MFDTTVLDVLDLISSLKLKTRTFSFSSFLSFFLGERSTYIWHFPMVNSERLGLRLQAFVTIKNDSGFISVDPEITRSRLSFLFLSGKEMSQKTIAEAESCSNSIIVKFVCVTSCHHGDIWSSQRE